MRPRPPDNSVHYETCTHDFSQRSMQSKAGGVVPVELFSRRPRRGTVVRRRGRRCSAVKTLIEGQNCVTIISIKFGETCPCREL